jgi:hypothetical protein
VASPARAAAAAAAPVLPTLGIFVTLVLYLESYRKMKTPFGLGILIFVVVLLAQNCLQVLLAIERVVGSDRLVSPNNVAFVSDLLELGGLTVLLYLATR